MFDDVATEGPFPPLSERPPVMATKTTIKRRVNKSQLVRDELSRNMEASPSEVAHKLKKHKIAPGFVSNVKTKMKKDMSGNGKSTGPVFVNRSTRASGQPVDTKLYRAIQLLMACQNEAEAMAAIKCARTLQKLFVG
jgi:hypothetical protein